MAEVILSAQQITKSYFRKTRDIAANFNAVSNVSLEVHAGELVEIIGRSGGGKTTLLNMLSGILEPSEGEVHFGDTNLYSLGDAELSKLRNQNFGMVPQGQTALYSLTVLENVLMPHAMYNEFSPEVERYAVSLLEQMGIAELADIYPVELSGGEMRRMAIARALAHKPSIVFADEPSGDLDDENTHIVLSMLRKAADDGAAVVLVTHEREAEQYATKTLRMDAGKIVDEL